MNKMIGGRVLEQGLVDPIMYADGGCYKKTRYRLEQLTEYVNFRGVSKLCEVCCGTGDLSYLIALNHPFIKMMGVDISEEAVRYAQKNHEVLPNLRYEVSDCNDLGEKGGDFDLVICIKSLHHFSNPKELIEEMLMVTKRGGRIYIDDFTRGIIPAYMAVLELWEQRGVHTDNDLLSQSIKASLSEHEFKELASELGLSSNSNLEFVSYNYHTLDSVYALFSGIEIPEVRWLITKR